MQFKYLSLLALASFVTAQDQPSDEQDLNATLTGNTELSNLTALITANPELLAALSNATNITILAPSNEAFAAFANTTVGQEVANDPGLLQALLQYHVINGTVEAADITNTSTFVPTLLTNETYTNVTGGQVVEAVTIGNETLFYSGLLQNSTVTTADVRFTGGIVHIISSVLLFPPSVLDGALALNLTSLRGAVNATDSVEAAGSRDVTIFAPNNEAFNSIGSALANLSIDDLRNIIAYHVVPDVRYSSSLENGTTLQSLDDNQELTISVVNGSVFVNAAEVVVPNVLLANGVLHVIDNVLNPDNTAAATEGATTGAPGFTGSAASEVPFTSGQPTPTTTVNPTSEGAGPAQSTAAESSTSGPAMPLMTGGVEYAALLGAGAAVFFGAA